MQRPASHGHSPMRLHRLSDVAIVPLLAAAAAAGSPTDDVTVSMEPPDIAATG